MFFYFRSPRLLAYLLLATAIAAPGSHGGDWAGYMNVFDKQPDGSQGGYVFGNAWGVADLKTTLIATPGIGTEITNNQLELFPNYNTFSSSDPFWGNGPVGNKWMEANTFVEQASLTQESVTFSGTVDNYTLSPNYTAEAYIKVLDPANGYATSLFERQNLSGITEFSLTADTFFFTGQLLQIGFAVSGVNANPADMATLGSVRVTTEPSSEPTPIDWRGYMNVSELTPQRGKGGYIFGQTWGVPDLQTTVVTPQRLTLDDNQLILAPNFNTYTSAINDTGTVSGPEARAFWTNSTSGGITAGPLGNKWMDGLSLVEENISSETDGSFSGRIDDYSLAADYTAQAFVRVLNPSANYAESYANYVELAGRDSFALEANLSNYVGQVLQRGFMISGVNANPTDADRLGSVRVTTNPTGDIIIHVPAGEEFSRVISDFNPASAQLVTKTGDGVLILDTGVDYTLPTRVEAGLLRVTGSESLTRSHVTIAGGTLEVTSDAQILSLSVEPSGALKISSDTPITAFIQSANLTGHSGRGQVDVGVGRIEVAAGGIAEADLLQAIIAGRNGGGWDGIDGIMSSAAGPDSNRAVGYRVLDSGETIISWAAYGDVNLDGRVSSSDINLIINEGLYGTTQPATWASGDFNYDGRVDVLDMTLLTGTGLFGTGSYLPAGPAPTAAGQQLTAAAVPEPGFDVILLTYIGVVGGSILPRVRDR